LNYWLLKTEPESYSYANLAALGRDGWNGVRNFRALKYMRSMEPGDLAFIYHTGKEKAIVGVAQVASTAYPDPAQEDPRYIVVDVKPGYPMQRPITLAEIKANPFFADWALVHQPRLSVMPVSSRHWQEIHALSHTPAKSILQPTP